MSFQMRLQRESALIHSKKLKAQQTLILEHKIFTVKKELVNELLRIAKKKINNDISHDFGHACRVLGLAVKIAKEENADLDVIIPAAIFHDVLVYKGTEKYDREHEDSAAFAGKILTKMKGYPKSKIEKVSYCISVCSFSRNIKPKSIEAMILQDADLLESTGAVAIMRTFGSSAPMHVSAFYDLKDPFSTKRKPDNSRYSLDLFFTRLLKVNERIHTRTARKIASRRKSFLKKFIKELSIEIKESDNDP
jgi:uncharacterized protein